MCPQGCILEESPPYRGNGDLVQISLSFSLYTLNTPPSLFDTERNKNSSHPFSNHFSRSHVCFAVGREIPQAEQVRSVASCLGRLRQLTLLCIVVHVVANQDPLGQTKDYESEIKPQTHRRSEY
jgi:hypothetical protein